MTFSEKVYAVVRKIPRGKFLTYKEVARQAGSPRAFRAVGNILNKNPRPDIIPCHCVIRSDGKIGGYRWGSAAKLKLLKEEGLTPLEAGLTNKLIFATIAFSVLIT